MYKRITIENESKSTKDWIKTVYIFGVKIATWEYYYKHEDNNLGFRR